MTSVSSTSKHKNFAPLGLTALIVAGGKPYVALDENVVRLLRLQEGDLLECKLTEQGILFVPHRSEAD